MQEIDGRVILLILFVVVSAVKWLAEKIKTSDKTWEGEEPPGAAENLYEQFRDEIRQRQTRLQRKEPVQTPLSPPPAHPQAAKPVARNVQPAPSHQASRTVVTPEQMAAASRFEQHLTRQRKPSAQKYVRALLSSPQSARQAIILAEILGKPKSLHRG